MQSIQQNIKNPIDKTIRPQNIQLRDEERKELEEESKKFDLKLMKYFGNEFYERKLEITPKRNLLENFLINEDFEKLIPNYKLYKYLQNLEKGIDDKIYKTRLDIQEQLIKPKSIVKALLRTQIFAFILKDDNGNEKFNMRIQGKIINNFPENHKMKYDNKKFTDFLSGLSIKFENNIYQKINWKNNYRKDNLYDNYYEQNIDNKLNSGFMIQRELLKNIKNFKVEIELYINYPNLEFSLSPQLNQILGIKQGTRTNILYHMWQYIKLNSLQDNENPCYIINNTPLQKIFKCEKMNIVSLIGKLNDHLKEPEPIIIEFNIKDLSYDYKKNEILKDIVIDIEDPYFNNILSFLSNYDEEKLLFPKHLFPNPMNHNEVDNYLYQINDIDKKMNSMINILNKHKYRYEFYEAYSKDPIKFINNFVIQQNELIKILDENSLIESRNDYTSSQYCKEYEEVIRQYVEKYLLNKKNQNLQNKNQNLNYNQN